METCNRRTDGKSWSKDPGLWYDGLAITKIRKCFDEKGEAHILVKGNRKKYFWCSTLSTISTAPRPSKNSVAKRRSKEISRDKEQLCDKKRRQNICQSKKLNWSSRRFVSTVETAVTAWCGCRCFWWKPTKFQVLHDFVQGSGVK